MQGRLFSHGYLTNVEIRQGISLTLITFLFFISTFCHASDLYSAEERQRISDVENYIRKESMQGVTLLPGEVRSTLGWFSGKWHAMPMAGGDEEDADQGMPQLLPESDSPHQAPGKLLPFDLASNFHHKGFLPTHDAMVMGMGFGRSAFDNKLNFTAHPFYGQNWRSLQGYWGANLTMDIAKRDDGMPWGNISIGYIQGNEQLTDHGRGTDLHGDVDLTEGWKFTAGMRQNTINGGSNYAMLRWKLEFK